jgi:hypothetical protein
MNLAVYRRFTYLFVLMQILRLKLFRLIERYREWWKRRVFGHPDLIAVINGADVKSTRQVVDSMRKISAVRSTQKLPLVD